MFYSKWSRFFFFPFYRWYVKNVVLDTFIEKLWEPDYWELKRHHVLNEEEVEWVKDEFHKIQRFVKDKNFRKKTLND